MDKDKERHPKPRRIGRFSIAHEWLTDGRWKELTPLFAQCSIVRAESMYAECRIDYVAFSEAFDEIDVAVETPKYQVEMKRMEDGQVQFVRFVREK